MALFPLNCSCAVRISSRTTHKSETRAKAHSWLSGVMKCAKCGYSITVQRRENGLRRMICSGRYNLSQCDADIRADLTEMENAVAAKIEKLLTECPPSEPVGPI